jgi:hypothetical protein
VSDGNDKSPEQVSDEDYKVAPTSADAKVVNKASDSASKKRTKATGENYDLGQAELKEELKEGIE